MYNVFFLIRNLPKVRIDVSLCCMRCTVLYLYIFSVLSSPLRKSIADGLQHLSLKMVFAPCPKHLKFWTITNVLLTEGGEYLEWTGNIIIFFNWLGSFYPRTIKTQFTCFVSQHLKTTQIKVYFVIYNQLKWEYTHYIRGGAMNTTTSLYGTIFKICFLKVMCVH